MCALITARSRARLADLVGNDCERTVAAVLAAHPEFAGDPGTLTDLTVRGSTARGREHFRATGGTLPITARLEHGQWKVDLEVTP